MLKSLRLVESETHEDLFLERYDRLFKWAMHLAGNNRQAAEDLLQDAFVQFTFSRPDISSIHNLDAYIYGILRHLHLSQIRQAANRQWQQFSLLECDSAEIGLRSGDTLNDLQVKDELRGICEYACIRKDTSKAASVLILRFFHGYYPREIADVLSNSIQTVKVWLHTARAEAKVYLHDPNKLAFLKTEKKLKKKNFDTTKSKIAAADILGELRRTIFDAGGGVCLPEKRLHELYTAGAVGITALDVAELSHMVSCGTCLDKVNQILDLAVLADRYPTDMIGKDSNKKDRDDNDHGTGGGGGSGGGNGDPKLKFFRKRAREVFEHFPSELQVAVNGYVHSAQKINSATSEISLLLGDEEPIQFIEIFGGQRTRLALMPVSEPPPEGPLEQKETISLSENRTLELQLVFGSPKPTLQVVYSDPTFVPDDVQVRFANLDSTEINSLSPSSVEHAVEIHTSQIDMSVPPVVAGGDLSEPGTVVTRFLASPPYERSDMAEGRGRSLASQLWDLFSPQTWLQPARLTVAITLLLLAGGAYWFINHEPAGETLTARSVLTQARNAEYTLVSDTAKVVHRNYQVEEWVGGDLSLRRRIDEWQKKNISATRTYDENGKMIAGEWSKADGSRQVFEQGERLRTVSKTDRDAGSDPIRDIEPTATYFSELVDQYGVASKVTLDAGPNAYRFNYQKDSGTNEPNGLLVASLTLDRNSLLPVGETVVLRVGDETREYRFTDVRVEQKPVDDVSPLIFEPEAELTRGATKVTKPLGIADPVTTANANATAGQPVTTATATLETEVEVFKALDQINALSGEQITVTRDATNHLRVAGIVDSPARKTEILNALAAVRNAPGVVIDVQTAAEAASRRKQSNSTLSIESVTAEVEQQLPVEPELRAYFSKKGVSGDSLNSEVKSYANAVLNRSRALRRNALALKQLAERFSPAEIDRLEPARREEWKSLLRSKAAAVAGDVRSLQSQLVAVLGSQNAGGADASNVRDASDAAQAAQRLFGLAAACDSQISQSFSISSSGGSTAAVKSVQFWRNLKQMADIAAEVQKL
jgi:RNA polymerase sigma factor (sigma-70 family)